MIGYKMGFSMVGIPLQSKKKLVENFKHGWKNDTPSDPQ